ncbi:4'-phosphopantetheinyl transferase superfamily protein [Panacibacter ginsenosidivorans]|uniref:4'-phosphopantetheinyl transferase superfamily protein n=1 Tax=Panacibacter ginsenosidivorans TaxID=1813871 RepID=A0A5B8V8K3_9BACT|nr:4'-phosphopantetheinyl transferase superfamily protein [Panacibacter ginsenosidivorans]QEC67870.1 4'-phosphopantetheinyl transferase superfamily protein [Panacibacter ginsenosidivorans]
MALFYQHNINDNTKLGIWQIEEPEDFFLASVPQHRAITHPHKRLQHLAGRYLLKHLFPDFPYEEIVIADTRKPYLPYEQYHFSISHCGNYAAAIVSRKERVGIDIELPTGRIKKISHKFLNIQEREHFHVAGTWLQDKADTSLTLNDKSLTVLWCAKEAVYKWWGWGSVDFSDHILLQPFEIKTEGSIAANFIRMQRIFDLGLQYKVFEGLCLVWLSSAA